MLGGLPGPFHGESRSFSQPITTTIMSAIRQDPTTKEWVIVATERAKRPHDFRRAESARVLSAHDPECPFCPGNEGATPSEVLRIAGLNRQPWTVRVIPNKFAALTHHGELNRREPGLLFREMDGFGFHEVIIETPVHNRFIPFMNQDEVECIISAYQQRYRAVRDDASVKYILIFKNHGEAAGTSLQHPHSQLVATPIPPVLLRRKYEVATQYFDDTGRCLYCDLVQSELDAGQRVVLGTERFVVFHPYASRVPFETWIVPRAHQPSFGRATAEDVADLASVLTRVLRGLHEALGDPGISIT